jgi:hypothetical protein
MKAAVLVVCCVAILAGSAWSQEVISAKSGTLNYTEGTVLLNAQAVKMTATHFPRVSADQELATEAGRAEVLLSPGVYLRAGEQTRLRMLSDRLEDTRVELVSGSIVVESTGRIKGNDVTLVYKDATISLLRDGVYRLDSDPGLLRVYDGEARVEQADQSQTVKKSRQLALNGIMVAEKFDNKAGDALLRWARQRAEYVALANPSAANSLRRNGMTMFGWIWNPYYGMYTFVPGRGRYSSFWGYSFWSPASVYSYYYRPQPAYNPPAWNNVPSVGYTSMPSTSYGTSGTAAVSSPPTAASSSSTASAPRESSSAGGSRR